MMAQLQQDIRQLLIPISEWVAPQVPVLSVLQLLEKEGYILVGSASQPLGLITEKTLIKSLRQLNHLEGVTVAQIMETPVPLLWESEDLGPQQIWALMQQQQLSLSVMMDHAGVVGVIPLERLHQIRTRALQHSESQLQQQEDLYRALIENSPDVIERFDRNFRHLYVSPALTQITGIPVDEFWGQTCREMGLPDSMVDLWEAAAQDVYATGEKRRIEFEIPTVNGLRSFEMILAPERDQDQQIVSLLCLSRDITERQQALYRVQNQEVQKRTILSALSEGVVQHQRNGQICFCNESACQILGLTTDQILGRSSVDPDWSTIYEDGTSFPGDQHPAMVTLRTGDPQRNVIMGVRRPDRSLAWISINTQPLLDPQTQSLSGVVASFSDITEQKQLENRLRSQLNRLQLLNQTTQAIRQTLDPQIILSTAVQQTRQFLQTDRVVIYRFLPDRSGDFIAESISDPRWSCLSRVVKDDCFTRDYQHQYQAGRIRIIPDIYQAGINPCHLELLEQFDVKASLIVPILRGSDLWGLLIAHHCSGPKHWDRESSELMAQIADQLSITIQQAQLVERLQQTNEQLRYQIDVRNGELQQMVEQLQDINQLKDEFVHMVSHELRTPLTNMKMALTMLESRPDPERQQRYFQVLKAEWRRELNLVNELLELLALESGNRQLEVTPIDLSDWIAALVDSLQMRFMERQLQFNWQIDPQLDQLYTDAHLLERILLELLNNACKYTPPHERISLIVLPTEFGISLEVINRGVEIPPNQIDRIFDKFHRVTSLDRYQQGGTGLGLALVKKAIDLLEGEIKVCSEAGVTRFQVIVPNQDH